MTRIRYNKNSAGQLVSKNAVLLPSGQLVSIVLDATTNTYTFLENGVLVSQGSANSLLTLKKLVRSTLLELGVPLEVEVKKFKKNEEEVAA